jgi:hypothetical protein
MKSAEWYCGDYIYPVKKISQNSGQRPIRGDGWPTKTTSAWCPARPRSDTLVTEVTPEKLLEQFLKMVHALLHLNGKPAFVVGP